MAACRHQPEDIRHQPEDINQSYSTDENEPWSQAMVVNGNEPSAPIQGGKCE
jgi:hypothetical protein